MHVTIESQFPVGQDVIEPPIPCINITTDGKISGVIFCCLAKFGPRIFRWIKKNGMIHTKITFMDGEEKYEMSPLNF